MNTVNTHDDERRGKMWMRKIMLSEKGRGKMARDGEEIRWEGERREDRERRVQRERIMQNQEDGKERAKKEEGTKKREEITLKLKKK